MPVEYKAMKDTDGFYYVEDSNGVVYRNTKSITLSDAKGKAEVQGLRLQLGTFAGRLKKVERLDMNLHHVKDTSLDLLNEVLDLYMASAFIDEDQREIAKGAIAGVLTAAIVKAYE